MIIFTSFAFTYARHIRFSVPWHVGFGINSKVFDMETDFETICMYK